MKLVLFSLFSLVVAGAHLEARQQGGPPNRGGGQGGGRGGPGQGGGGQGGGNRNPPTTVRTTVRTTARASPTPAPVCEWTGHCIGDSCAVDEDCDLDYPCVNKNSDFINGTHYGSHHGSHLIDGTRRRL
ncbi:hypothetical protein QBC47DRAFT_398961 [Echria macrotheca]|uniref:Uncharacterized protein n=1 Tax=Echria macrotheca TaxID=438768 RepID=A0AAJ0BGZ9_9PEZI|nr:hypothetical protein QBC47DRAFT_398961 [Echria macrotheca]